LNRAGLLIRVDSWEEALVMRKVLRSTPLLVVSDVRRSAEFFVRVLAYADPTFYGGDPPRFAMLNRDGHDLMLEIPRGGGSVAPHGRFGVWDLHLLVEDVQAERQAIEASGWKCSPIATTEYEMLEITVEDPDGHRICLGQNVRGS
jgi:hypothetical protein